MTREEFKVAMTELIERAKGEIRDNNSILDLRANKDYMYDNIFRIDELDECFDFVQDGEEWFVDIYENLYPEEYAIFPGQGLYFSPKS